MQISTEKKTLTVSFVIIQYAKTDFMDQIVLSCVDTVRQGRSVTTRLGFVQRVVKIIGADLNVTVRE